MAEIKTHKTTQSVDAFLKTIEPEQKQKDAFTLLKMMTDITGEEAALWSSNIVGFGTYHYKSERSSQEGDWMMSGFSPRKQNLTIYIMSGLKDSQDLLAKLGKHKISGGSCLYINKLADVDLEVLKTIIKKSYEDMVRMHT